jgi:hypothetical protein
MHLNRRLISPRISGVVLYLNRRHAPYGNLRFKYNSVQELKPVDRLPVHELSAVNDHSLRFKYRPTTILPEYWPDPEKVDMRKIEFCSIKRSRTNEEKSI